MDILPLLKRDSIESLIAGISYKDLEPFEERSMGKRFDVSEMRGLWNYFINKIENPDKYNGSKPMIDFDTYIGIALSKKEEWDCVIKMVNSHVISGGFIPSGVIGGKGLVHHNDEHPYIDEEGFIRIYSII
jgi:hypothetical protein